jgi:hypothetical protein
MRRSLLFLIFTVFLNPAFAQADSIPLPDTNHLDIKDSVSTTHISTVNDNMNYYYELQRERREKQRKAAITRIAIGIGFLLLLVFAFLRNRNRGKKQ